MQEVTVILPEKLSTNKIYRMHFTEKNSFQQAVNIAVKEAVQKQKIKPIKEYPVICVYVFYITGKYLDILNLGGMAKAVEDGLRYAKIFKDDSKKYIEQVTLLEERSDKKYSYVTVEIN